MADRIRITPSELESQATRLTGLGNQMEDITSKADRALSLMEDALSSKFTSNMDKKGKTLLKNLKSLKNSLRTGAKVAAQCATSYQNADKVLRDEIGDSLPQDVINSPVSNQEVFNSPLANTKEYNNTTYHALDYEDNIMSQNSYDGYEFGYGDYNAGCTATAWCMGLSIMDGKKYNPTSSEMWINGEGATFKGQGISVWGNETNMLKEAYNQLMNGKPSVFYAEHYFSPDSTSKCPHAVTIVGITSTANPEKLTMNDFLVVDPWGGVTKTLAEVNYCGYPRYSRLITYQ